MNSIKNTCVRVKLTLGKQSAYVTDKKISDSIESGYSTKGRGKFIKRRFKDCVPFKELQSLSSEIYSEFKRSTLPWDDAYSVCKAEHVMALMQKIGDLNDKLRDKVERFAENLPSHVDSDIAASNGLMQVEDYPSADELRANFYVRFDVSPMPGVEDFRVTEGLSDEDVEKLIERAKASESERLSKSLDEARGRLHKVIGHLGERLKEYSGSDNERLHKSLLTNTEDCVEALRKLNITNDPELDKVMNEVEHNILGRTDIERLKVFPEERNETINKVNDILNKMAFFNRKESE